MLILVIAEAELERIPASIATQPAIVRYASQKGKPATKLILDSNYHHAAMNNLTEGRRRGRPDITHLILLTALESILNKQGKLQVYIHTRNDEVITVSSQTRIMRSDERFTGLLEQLFDTGAVPDLQKPLLSLRKQTLPELLAELHPDHVFACDQHGTPTLLSDYYKRLHQQQKTRIVAIIGGFPSGTFHTDLSTIVNEAISLYPDMLVAWAVASELIVTYEHATRQASP